MAMGSRYSKCEPAIDVKACLSRSNENSLTGTTYNPMRHLFQVHLVALQCRDILNTIKADGDNKNKLSDILQKTCQDYAHCALLASNTKNYRNIKEQPTIAAVIVGVMRALGISDLPLTMETGRVEVLIKFLSKALTTKRNHIKTQIVSSIKDKVDIATLTRACIGTSPAVPTAAVYLRIALIRSIVVELNKTGSTSVGAGDEPKTTPRTSFGRRKTNIQLTEPQSMFEAIHREDIVSYGEPDNKIPLTLMQDVEGWLTTLNKATEK
ncbi:hypothetical protein B0H14DRAFT_2556658 [Mycena olivaceomarginata]|nr:hypothetical protein B0H14DRAFT_2556658 [Mycena olivaceomarginata]